MQKKQAPLLRERTATTLSSHRQTDVVVYHHTSARTGASSVSSNANRNREVRGCHIHFAVLVDGGHTLLLPGLDTTRLLLRSLLRKIHIIDQGGWGDTSTLTGRQVRDLHDWHAISANTIMRIM